jgi:ABC-2 type transport system permease protein
MRSLLTVALNDLRLFLLNRGNLVGLLVIPAALTFVVGFFYPTGAEDGDGDRLRVDVVDQDHSALSLQFIHTLRQVNQRLVLCPMDNGDDDLCGLGNEVEFGTEWATERVEESTSLAMVEIPVGFGASVQAFEPVEIVYLSNEDLTAPGYIRQAVQAAIQRVNGAAVASRVGTYAAEKLQAVPLEALDRTAFAQGVYNRAAALWDENPAGITFELTSQDTSDDPWANGFNQSVPGMGSMYVMVTVFGAMTALVVERHQWTFQRLVLMPVSRRQLLSGKILSRFTLGLIQYLVVFAVGGLLGVKYSNDPLALVLLMVAFTLSVTALSLAVGTGVKTQTQASSLGQLLVLTLVPLGGAWWPLEIVPVFLRVAGHISPVAWAMDGFHVLIFENGDLSQVTMPILVLLVMAIAFFVIGVRRFRYD